jgi:hypothetical protein
MGPLPDGVVLVQQATNGDRAIDNEVLTVGGQTVYRQRVAVADLDLVLARLNEILGAVDGLEVTTDQISIDAGTVNLSTDQLESLLTSLLTELGQKYEGGPIALDAATIAALESTTVTVTNPTTNPETGLAKDTTLVTQSAKIPNQAGTWAYYAGTSGTVNVTAGQRVLGIAAHATTAGSMTINGGASVPIPAGTGIQFSPVGNLVAPTLVLTGTDSYVIEVVSG